MKPVWDRLDREAVLAALRRSERLGHAAQNVLRRAPFLSRR